MSSIVSEATTYFCSSCLISFDDEKSYNAHYKTDFHRFNVKRKMAGFQPVSLEQFEKWQQESAKQDKAKFVKPAPQSFYCQSCKKKFTNKATYDQHLLTKKHKENEAKFNQISETKKDAITEPTIERGNPTENINACLFCGFISESFEDNLKHMSNKHGFFILEQKNCSNIKGLFKYLANKIYKEKMCIFYDYHKCGKFKEPQDVQQHMIDKGHCCMNQDLFDEYDKYYDFTAENEAIAKRLEEKYKNLPGGQDFVYKVDDKKKDEEISEEDSDEEDEEWADCDSEDNIIEEEKPKKKLTQRQKEYVLKHARMLDTDELMLPSGKIAGHRKYKTYYTQRPHIRTEEGNIRFLENGRKVYGGRVTYDTAVMLKNKVNNGEIMLADYHKHLARERQKVDKHLKHVYRARDHKYMRLGVAGNLTLRHHFRDRTIVFG